MRSEDRHSTGEIGGARWPDRLIELARIAHAPGDAHGCEAARGELWLILRTVLRQNLRQLVPASSLLRPEDVEDIASEKALELLLKFDQRRWRPEAGTSAEAVRFLQVVARNSKVDHWRRSRKMTPGLDFVDGPGGLGMQAPERDGPEVPVEREGFVACLLQCLRGLKEQHRTVWFFRVLYEMSSKSIAAHPEVRLQPGHVDVILQRCRQSLRQCMQEHGFAVHEMPPGSFTELWRALRRRGVPFGEEAHES